MSIASQAWSGLAAERDALEAENKTLREALTGLVGLAEMRGGHLHEYRSAIEDAKTALGISGAVTGPPDDYTDQLKEAAFDLFGVDQQSTAGGR